MALRRGVKKPPKFGKLADDFMARFVYRNLGAPSEDVLVGPQTGFDNAVVRLGGDHLMVVTTDPLSLVPRIGARKSAWLSVHLIASDLSTSGLAPRFASFSINFPPDLGDETKKQYLEGLGTACKQLGTSIISGHTGTYPGAGHDIIGGGTMFGVGGALEYLTPAMARVGDTILVTKHAAIEAAAYLSISFPGFTDRSVGRSRAVMARSLLDSCSTVRDAEAAVRAGMGREGVTSMHDATEGGVLGALAEMARASGHAFVVNEDAIPVSDETNGVCAAFGLDPLTSLSEGALLVTCSPGRTAELKARMSESKIDITPIGTVRSGVGVWVSRGDRPPRRRRQFVDGYWDAYADSMARGLD